MSLDLETAASPKTLRRIAIEPVSRVEGHGKVTLLLDDDGKVHQVRLHIVEFRGFEKFIQGRPYWEVPVMVQRLCGRMVVGLDFNSISFAVLPPQFNTATSALLSDEFWRTILPNFDSLPTPFKSCLPYLLASVLYHEDFLRSKFPAAHSLWSAPVFANNPMYDQLKRGLLLGVGYCEDTHMSATGIPPHLAIAKQVNDMIEQFKGCRKEIDELKQLITGDLPRLVGDYIRGNFHVEGDALNVGDLDRRDAGLKTYILELINGLKASNQAVLDSHAQQRQGSGHAGHVQGSHDWWKTWDLDGLGNARYTPLQFQCPFALAAATMWRLWLFGNRSLGIRPY